ncbi:MAG: hypothetical protein KIT61_02140 [Pyrinomonadaceae bacterium]|nr:hypothetical protein [Blastocatellia bacterium]MCW5955355.1 hypothetical protein [Pyrinomonadaceae bacterium]
MAEPLKNKQYRLIFDDRPDYLHALVQADQDSYEISRQFWQDIADECGRLKPKRLLVEEDIDRPIESIADTYQGASERPLMGLSGIKIAFLDTHPEQHEQNQFGELVARNRGINVKVFFDRKEAENWLIADQ